jgi:hypothetical protein
LEDTKKEAEVHRRATVMMAKTLSSLAKKEAESGSELGGDSGSSGDSKKK